MATPSERSPVAAAPATAALSALREDAAHWVVRLQAPHPEDAELLAFDAWLSASTANREAYDQVLSAWVKANGAASRRRGARPAPSRGKISARTRGSSAARPRPLAWAAAAAAVILAALLAAPYALRPPPAAQYATGRGEHRQLILADGTRVELNAATRIEVELTRNSRRVALREGEAAFEVRHDAARPFRVTAPGGELDDLGTAFDVRQRGSAFSVTVARGRVGFTAAGAPADRAVLLGPGERLETVDGARRYRVLRVSAEEDFGWRKGVLVFRDQTLGSVIDELNLQFPRPIRLADRRLAARPISGVLRLEGQLATVRRLALFTPMIVAERGGVIVLEPAPDRKP